MNRFMRDAARHVRFLAHMRTHTKRDKATTRECLRAISLYLYTDDTPAFENIHFTIPFSRDKEFVGRDAILDDLLERVIPSADESDCQIIAIGGPSGIGKTQVALEAAYRVHDKCPDCSVFWVSATSMTAFENGYREIGKQLGLPEAEDMTGMPWPEWRIGVKGEVPACFFARTCRVEFMKQYVPEMLTSPG